MLFIALSGFLSGLALIAAIGAQNAFVLRQGVRREHVGAVVAVCAISDAVLIALGVAGFGEVAERVTWLVPVMLWGGVAFLFAYGALRFKAAFRGGAALVAADGGSKSLSQTLWICLALTWLNPHVYLDTLALLGALATQYAPNEWWFGAGAALSSLVFFASLGYGGRLLAPILARPRAWVIAEFVIGAIMWALAAKLVIQAIG